MPWCNQGAELWEETASTAGNHRAEWGGEIDSAEDSFAGYDAEFGADQGAGADCFIAGGWHGVQSDFDRSQWNMLRIPPAETRTRRLASSSQ